MGYLSDPTDLPRLRDGVRKCFRLMYSKEMQAVVEGPVAGLKVRFWAPPRPLLERPPRRLPQGPLQSILRALNKRPAPRYGIHRVSRGATLIFLGLAEKKTFSQPDHRK